MAVIFADRHGTGLTVTQSLWDQPSRGGFLQSRRLWTRTAAQARSAPSGPIALTRASLPAGGSPNARSPRRLDGARIPPGVARPAVEADRALGRGCRTG